MQPFLRELLTQLRVSQSKDIVDIATLDLGKVVRELSDVSGVKDLFEPQPWRLLLSQWRNVAQHHSFEIRGEEIRCWYGKGQKEKTITLTRSELWELLYTVFNIHFILRTAYIIFLIENLDQLQPMITPAEERVDAALFRFAVASAGQGFEVQRVEVENERAFAVLKDVSDGDVTVRAIHASQFVEVLWEYTRAERCEVEYRSRDDIPTLFASASAQDCEAVAKESITWGEFAGRVSLKAIRNRESD
jgi:hypothetical protein